MAELVQGQGRVAQPGSKDDFAEAIRRIRQVTNPPMRNPPLSSDETDVSWVLERL